MKLKPTLSFFTLTFSLLWFAGCCGPNGGGCGPIFFGAPGCGTHGCGGCDSDGCGELYVDPWVNHPADAGDPCDKCSNHNGQSCGKCRSVFSGVESLWGYRRGVDVGCGGCDIGCNSCAPACDSGCSDCDSHSTEIYHGETYHSETYSEGEYISGDSYQSGETIVESPAPSYQPQRTRKIFRSKPQVARGVPTPANR
ncbi:hypothetical protein Pla52o_13350 [Novipirellula galeiformis]|uniref:4Fe-4S ferredoxin-type domain-containing protein n=1 Tax=Novipirellula galeiformis TaxID=2528004 RepID=A0A5C6CKR5_9BACT|nr:hypothetical protein [Novipirellula galeiformis]TWU25038.1 hypothetical protein Pla52o_13350 [Novipirellula galeiformis]